MEVNMSARAGVGSVIVATILGVLVAYSVWGMAISFFTVHGHRMRLVGWFDLDDNFFDHLVGAVVFGLLFLWMKKRYLRISGKE